MYSYYTLGASGLSILWGFPTEEIMSKNDNAKAIREKSFTAEVL